MREQKKKSDKIERKQRDSRELYQEITSDEGARQGALIQWVRLAASGGPVALVCVTGLLTMAAMAHSGVMRIEPYLTAGLLAAFGIGALLVARRIHGTTAEQRNEIPTELGAKRTGSRKTRSSPLPQ